MGLALGTSCFPDHPSLKEYRMPTHYPRTRPWRTATPAGRHHRADRPWFGVRRRADRAWFGVRCGLRAGVRGGVLLELDPRTDPLFYPTALLNRPVRVGSAAATDPCLGVSRWGRTRYGGA